MDPDYINAYDKDDRWWSAVSGHYYGRVCRKLLGDCFDLLQANWQTFEPNECGKQL